MSLDAIIMMTVILLLVWGGFVLTLLLAVRQEHREHEGETVDGESDA